MNKLLLGIVVVFLIAAGFVFGIDYGQEIFEPQIVEVTNTVDHYVTQVVEREVIVEKEVIVTLALREFASLQELEDWLKQDKTNVVVFKAQGVSFVDIEIDCDEYAEALVKAAEKDGYRLSIQIDTKKGHALNNAFIGNDIYFIEPQTDEVWLEIYRD